MNSKVLSGWTLFGDGWAFWAPKPATQKHQVHHFDNVPQSSGPAQGVWRPEKIYFVGLLTI